MKLLKYLPWVRPKLNKDKLKLIDFAFSQCTPTPTSFADLGGVWNVNGAYTFYTLKQYDVTKSFLVDTNFTDVVLRNSRPLNRLKLLEGNFGEEIIAKQIDKIDAIFLFDVLLHQVKPDWNEVLELYSKRTNYFVIYNQQWTAGEDTVRLLDLGRDEYFKNVPHDKNHPTYIALFDKMNEMHPQHKRIWRDIHNVWQWGITDRDLTSTMDNLGFKLQFSKNCGRFGRLPNFEDHLFIFQKA